MKIDMQQISADLGEELLDVCQSLAQRHHLRFGFPEMLCFEFLFLALRKMAPMEFDEYLQEFQKETVNTDELNYLRAQLADTLNLTTNP